ncbi:lecithin retinol acyltransferase family protein [Treponema primitia]|uniref:lecithin retinol acyltransferase family protein n=1 Tax=Treponema primitia TaxID=88058 RepID=UPI0009D9A1A0|nr:lecithin retinol acyltransferase family protein [Treponema primitia]
MPGIEKAILKTDRNIPKLGDILVVSRGMYYHYGVYAGENRVIHYAAKSREFGDTICIHETTLNRFCYGRRYMICRFSDTYRKLDLGTKIFTMIEHPNLFTVIDSVSAFVVELSSSGFHLYSGKETADRARSRIGEGKYNLIFNNCEHFAIWCKTGISASSQVSSIVSILAAIPAKVR